MALRTGSAAVASSALAANRRCARMAGSPASAASSSSRPSSATSSRSRAPLRRIHPRASAASIGPPLIESSVATGEE